MGSTAGNWRLHALLCALAVLFLGTTALTAGPVGHGSSSSAHVASAPHIAGGGYGNWHAGTHAASGGFGYRGVAPRPIRPGGYRSGFGYGSGFGYRPGFGYGSRRGAVAIVPFYPFYDSSNYSDSSNYYDDAGAPGPPDAAADYGPPSPDYYQPPYGPGDGTPSYPSGQAPPIHDAPLENQPPITVVLQSGQQLVIQNYAVMNGMLWDFSKPAVRKIPLASIDLSASARATSAAGAEFPELQ
jgi:hypothetical protein